MDETGQCSLCRLGLNGLDEVFSAGVYDGSLRKLIHLFKFDLFKFDGVRPLARPLGGFLAQALPREQRFDVIVPMPLHWRRRGRRGFNQSDLLAREIGRRWNIPVRKLVRRKRATAPQAGLTSSQPRKNVQGAFEAAKAAKLHGMSVLLIDDVLTTGATAGACARVLKRAGAAHVALLALARRDRWAGVAGPLNAMAASSGSLKQ